SCEISLKYKRLPSVTRLPFASPSEVIWVVERTIGDGRGDRSKKITVTTSKIMTVTPAIVPKRAQWRGAGLLAVGAPVLTTTVFPDVVSRCRRFRSARNSAALWQRTSRSFSKALLMMRSNSAGTSGLRRTGEAGARFKIESKITPEVSPRNGGVPV